MEDEPDEGLFVYMACAELEEDQVLADMAYSELHRRYVMPLHNRCRGLCETLLHNEIAPEDLTVVTLAKAYKKADSYKPGPDISKKEESRRTLGWLCKIARNLIRDQLRNPHRPGPLNSEVLDVDTRSYSPEDFAAFFSEQEISLYNPDEHRIVVDSFNLLPDRSKEVVLVSLIQRDRSPNKTHMLRGSAAVLAERLGTSADNIRQIRRNSIKIINDSLLSYRKGKGTGR